MHADFNIEVIKDFYYFSFIPILLISIFLLAQKYKQQFFTSVQWFSYAMLLFLFIITIFELYTNIHLPVHRLNSDQTPSAFFTNPNDLVVIILQLFFIISVLRKKTDSFWYYFIAFVITGSIVFIIFSRLALVAFIVLSTTIFLSKSFKFRDLAINLALILATIVYMNIDVPSAAEAKENVVDRSKTRLNSIAHLDKENDKVGSSVNIRLDIYAIPFRNPKEFIWGYGFNADKMVIEKYRSENYHIVNSHSFFIQMIFYFGWGGFILILLFFAIPIIYALFFTKKWNYFIPVLIAQVLLISIPSSIIRSPVNWIPLFIVLAFYIQKLDEKESLIIE
jgi:hypothetical protein